MKLISSKYDPNITFYGSDRYCQVLSSHSGHVRKLFLVLFPPHQRVCVVGHLLDFHVGLKMGFPFEGGPVEIHGCGTKLKLNSLTVSSGP
jgi:hypothetical protein